MPYSAYPDCVLPYHLDGTVIKQIDAVTGVLKTYSDAEKLEMNDEDYIEVAGYPADYVTLFFPELVDLHAVFTLFKTQDYNTIIAPSLIEWSADTTNGLDGTWATATMPGGMNNTTINLDSWRTGFVTMSGVSGAIALRFSGLGAFSSPIERVLILHLYGHKHAGETVNDIIFLDAEASYAELTIPLEFGDIPSGSSLQRIIAIKNTSPTLHANNVVITVVDPDDQIRIGLSNTGPWLTTQTTTLLEPAGAGDTSVDYYIKCEAPAPPTPLGPNRAPIKVVVGAWT